MNKAMCSLNFMYSMERFATAIYRFQKRVFKETAINEKMIYAVDNESQHASNLRKQIIKLNQKPFKLAFLFQTAGTILGCLSRCFSKELALKIDVLIEKRAVKDYSYFLKTLELDDKTKVLIKNIITDEDRHIKNWQDSIKLLKSKP
jgi:demethoxyubiquinone hydroxylase (CLK1/Coq7/Cat5 family)